MGTRTLIIIGFVTLAGCANENNSYRSRRPEPQKASSETYQKPEDPAPIQQESPPQPEVRAPQVEEPRPVAEPQPVTEPQPVPESQPATSEPFPSQTEAQQVPPPQPPPRQEPPQTPQSTPIPEAKPIASTTAEKMLTMVNEERAKHGLQPLILDAHLSAVAQGHARDMQTRNFFSHANPDGQHNHHRIQAAGLPFRTAAENIALGQQSVEHVMSTWIDSPGHRANILNHSMSKLGVGRAGVYWVQVFTD